MELSAHLENHPDRTLSTRSGIFFLPGEEFQDAKVAVLFPGQGSQYPGMMRELVAHRSEAQEFLQRVNLWRNSQSLESLNDVIYPMSAFDKKTLEDQRGYLTRTDNTQASLSFANLAAFEVLKSMGLQVDAVAGHSYGELSALYAADVVDFDSYMKLTHRRGELMRECNAKQGGAMLAVLAPKDEVLEARPDCFFSDALLVHQDPPGAAPGSWDQAPKSGRSRPVPPAPARGQCSIHGQRP